MRDTINHTCMLIVINLQFDSLMLSHLTQHKDNGLLRQGRNEVLRLNWSIYTFRKATQ